MALLISVSAFSQTNIGGVINTYVKVTAVSNTCSCPSSNCGNITVTSSTGYVAGDKVLLIQMKGARVDSTNSSAHGSVLNLFDAGNYEFQIIASVAGNVITTTAPIKQTYFTSSNPADSAHVQLIKVPVYAGNVNVTSTLTAQAYNGTTGGVLAFEVGGTLNLQANITVSGQGFHGAKSLQVAINCGDDTAFYYQSTTYQYSSCPSCGYTYNDASNRRVGEATYGGCASGGNPCFTNRMNSQDNKLGAFKGEGIAAFTFKKTATNGNIMLFDKGRGRWANGGGGGGNHNAGGGGGGNYGAGGWGGNAYNVVGSGGCVAGTHSVRRGYGGAGLTPTCSKLFMGGGGGEGHNNGGQGSTGTRGGGIIYITATSITNAGAYTITADGADNLVNATSDGSGGGGAGGTIMLNVSGSFGTVTISAKGGCGGDNSQSNCHGPGGGGGGGVIWFSQSSLPDNVTTVVTGGANGTNYHASFDCGTASWGSTSGGAGVVMYGTGSGCSGFLNSGTCSGSLPITLHSFTAVAIDEVIEVSWITESELNNDYFIVQKSIDGQHFTEMERVDGAGTSNEMNMYVTEDKFPVYGKNYYRLAETDFDGNVTYSQIDEVTFEIIEPEIDIYPNPVQTELYIIASDFERFDLTIMDVNGKIMTNKQNFSRETKISVEDYPEGLYMIRLSSGNRSYFRKVLIQH